MCQKNSIHLGIFVVAAIFTLGFSGCMASESQQGDSFVYTNTILKTLMLLGIAAVLLVIGAGILRESLKPPKPQKKKRTPRDGKRRKPEPPPTDPKKKIGAILLGSGLLLGGVLVLILGVPSSLVQHVTVSKDKVAMRLSVLWFSNGTREIPFSSIRSINIDEEQVATRRGMRTKQIMILSLDTGTERIEMGALEKAAYPKLKEMLEDYRNGGGDTNPVADNGQNPANPPAQNPPANVPAKTNPPHIAQNNPHTNPRTFPRKTTPFGQNPNSTNPAPPVNVANLTPVSHIGRFFKGGEAWTAGPGAATILEVYAEGKLKLMPRQENSGGVKVVNLADARPIGSGFVPKEFGPGTLIDPANPPAPGAKLLAVHAGRWFEVELLRMQGKNPVIKWPSEKNPNIATAKMVRVPPPEGTKPYDGKRYNPPTDAGLTPIEQRGNFEKGKEVYFKEGGVSRKVIIVQMYREFLSKVRDPATNEEFYAFSQELSNRP